MKRTKIDDRLDEIEERINQRQHYAGTLDQDDTDILWMITILRTLLDGRHIA